MITEKSGGNLIDKGYVAYVDIAITGSYEAGEIGTRALQLNRSISQYYTEGYKPISATIIATAGSGEYIPLTMLWENSQSMLLNIYRASTNAVTSCATTVRIFFVKE